MPYVAQLEGIWDDIRGAVAAVVPSHTIVGKAVRGDTQGAAVDAAKLGAKVATAAKAQPIPVNYEPPGTFSPGGFIEQNQTVLLLAAAGLAAFLVLKRRGRR